MKQTFLPIVMLLSVTLTLVAFLYFSDTGHPCCEEKPAKRIRTGIIYSSLQMTDVAGPVGLAAARMMD